MDDFDGGFDRKVIEVSMTHATERLDGGFNLRFMEDLMKDLMDGRFGEKNDGGFDCFDSRYCHWRQDRLEAGLDGAKNNIESKSPKNKRGSHRFRHTR